jgi:hypothetical protein
MEHSINKQPRVSLELSKEEFMTLMICVGETSRTKINARIDADFQNEETSDSLKTYMDLKKIYESLK